MAEEQRLSVKGAGGRPPTWDDPEKLAEQCDAYFAYCKGDYTEQEVEIEVETDEGVSRRRIKEKVWTRHPEPLTTTGLALFLGFESRQSLHDYKEKGEFSYVIKRALTIVEQGYEFRLHGDKPVGAIFALKNMNWKDQIHNETTLTGSITWNETKTYENLDDKKE